MDLREAGRLQLHGAAGQAVLGCTIAGQAVLGCTITDQAVRREKDQLQYKNLLTVPVGGL